MWSVLASQRKAQDPSNLPALCERFGTSPSAEACKLHLYKPCFCILYLRSPVASLGMRSGHNTDIA